MVSTLDETVRTGVIQRAEAATKQQVYVTMDVTLDGKECFVTKNARPVGMEISVITAVDIV